MAHDLSVKNPTQLEAPAQDGLSLGSRFKAMTGLQQKTENPATAPTVEGSVEKQNKEKAVAPKAKKSKKNKASSLRAKDKEIDRPCRITFYATDDEYEDVMIAKARLRKPVSDIAREATLSYLHNSYTCAACGTKFILVEDDETEPERAKLCPCCGGDKLARINIR